MEIGAVLLAGCGFSLLCVVALAGGAFFLFRFAGPGLVGGVVEMFRSVFGDDVSTESDRPKRKIKRPVSPGRAFRQRAQSLDFDEALSRYQNRPQTVDPQSAQNFDEPSPESGLGEYRPSLEDDPGGRDPRTSNLRSQKGRRRRRDDTYDIYDDGDFDGGILDDLGL